MVDAGKMIGPLPAGAWVAIVGGGVGIVWWTRTHPKASSSPIAVDNTSGLPGVGVGPAGFVAVSASPAASADNSTISTNDQWATQAITYLIGQGYEPTMADAAIRNYINGVATTTQQQALVDIAMKKFGAPPQTLSPPTANPTPIVPPPLPGGGTTPIPVTAPAPPPVPTPAYSGTPSKYTGDIAPVVIPGIDFNFVGGLINYFNGPPPATHMNYVVVKPWTIDAGSLWGIAQFMYGDGNRWTDLYNANKVGVTRPDGSAGWINNPNILYGGRTVYVP